MKENEWGGWRGEAEREIKGGRSGEQWDETERRVNGDRERRGERNPIKSHLSLERVTAP